MYKIEWDKETGGVILSSKVTKETLGIAPRPVFFEELDLIGLDKLGFTYPRCKDPILWAVNKQYFYRGHHLFDAKGANIYDMPTLNLAPGIEPMTLEKIDVEQMLAKNADLMFLLESEAIEFIRDTYVTYAGANRAHDAIRANNEVDYEALAQKVEKKTKTKMAVVKEDCESFDIVPLDTAKEEGKRVLLSTHIDRFIASFSGGKDSQVVLDLCTRAIPPTEFEVIYSDTGYELPPSLTLYEQVKQHYQQRFPALKFSITRNHESVLNYWDKIGTPSDTHRWCCSVMKTAPLYRSLKVPGTNRQARVLTFDGVRAEESTRRSGYNRIGKGVKHTTVINASPILQWNSIEIFFYLFKYTLPINPAYRNGATRVGCVICPFSSEWNDMIISRSYAESLAPFFSRIKGYVDKLQIADPKEYIKAGNWKRRAGGRDLSPDSTLAIIPHKSDLIIEVINCHKKFYTWLNAIGEFIGNEKNGSIKFDDAVYSYYTSTKENKLVVTFPRSSTNSEFQGLVKRALYKACYCINCEACEVECPTGALSILPEPRINKERCVHCQKCLMFHETGCVVAHSLKTTISKTTRMKLVGYNNFGLREEWLDYFLINTKGYFESPDHGLNVKEQLPSFTKWLIHAGILNNVKDRELTELGVIVKDIYKNNPSLVWEIIWINLTYDAPIAKWYSQSVPFLKEIADRDLRIMVKNDYPDTSDTTVKNIVYALLRTFKESPIGESLYQYVSENNQTFKRRPHSGLSLEALAYSLYKYSESLNTIEFRVSDIMSDSEKGPKVEFGIDRNLLMKMLRSLHTEGILIAELNMGLDHITLVDGMTPLKVLKIMTQ